MKKSFTLAEGATHVDMPNKKRSFGFTLAEVLITLGIIGVVAAITMPTLIQNHQKQVYVNQLKKTYSTLEQGFQKMLADEGVERLSDLPYWNEYCVSDYCDATKEKTLFAIDNFFNKGFKATYVNIPDYIISTTSFTEDGYNNQIQLADNSAIIDFIIPSRAPFYKTHEECELIKSKGGNMCSRINDAPPIRIDVNGSKGPNKVGRDIFEFYLSDEGKLYPLGGKDTYLYNYPDRTYQPCYLGKTCTACCTARIIENGWKMDY